MTPTTAHPPFRPRVSTQIAIWGFYEHLETLREELAAAGFDQAAQQLLEAERSGSTSGEILSNVGGELQKLLANDLPEGLRSRLEAVETEGRRIWYGELLLDVEVVTSGADEESQGKRRIEEAVGAIVRNRYGTATILDVRTGERLLVAVWEDWATLGLDREDGPLQFCPRAPVSGDVRFVVGGQEADIEGRFVVSASAATTVACEWLDSGEASALGYWERR